MHVQRGHAATYGHCNCTDHDDARARAPFVCDQVRVRDGRSKYNTMVRYDGFSVVPRRACDYQGDHSRRGRRRLGDRFRKLNISSAFGYIVTATYAKLDDGSLITLTCSEAIILISFSLPLPTNLTNVLHECLPPTTMAFTHTTASWTYILSS
jgi:hypothetical protein